MYEQHFGFTRPLFANSVPQDEVVFVAAAARALMRDLGIALSRKDSVAVVGGASGTGKTTLALAALKSISTRQAFATLNQPPRSADELPEQLLSDFGIEATTTSRIERIQLWRQFLAEMAATDTRVCLLVENAENLNTETLLALHRLTSADASLSPGANIILTTTRPAHTLLRVAELFGLSQRVRLRRELLPISEQETRDFLEFKCRLGERTFAEVFSDDAVPALYELTGGLLRVMDGMLESALLAAASQGESRIDADLLRSLAENHFGIRRLEPAEVIAMLEATAPEDSLIPLVQAGPVPADNIPVLSDYLIAPTCDDADLIARYALPW